MLEKMNQRMKEDEAKLRQAMQVQLEEKERERLEVVRQCELMELRVGQIEGDFQG